MHIPIRTCIFCRGKFEKSRLLKFVKKDKRIYFDRKHLLEGRGFYICRGEQCLKKALNKKNFEKRLHQKLTDAGFDEIEDMIRSIYYDKFVESEEVHCEKR